MAIMSPASTCALALAVATALLAGCASTATPATGTAPAASTTPAKSSASRAMVVLAPASGSLVSGTITLVPMGDGVHMTGEVGGLKPGDTRGFHIHEKGDCSAADASTAGGHFNPAAQAHGRSGQGPHHAGDTDNIVADGKGVARIDAHVTGVTLGGGASNDIAGRAVIVHAAADDYTTQPTGNAGARVACGIIKVAP